MLKILLAVDGSESAARATRKLIDTLSWYKEAPQIDLVTVHLPVPSVSGMSNVVSKDMLDRYYGEECENALAPSKKLLDAAGVKYTPHKLVGQIAESIVEQATKAGSSMIYMGTRGHSGVASLLVGSVAMKVLHLATVPVVLVR